MKLFEISSVYPAYARSFYKRHPQAVSLSYAQHKALADADGNGGAAPYAPLVSRHGIEMVSYYQNMSPLQQTWAKENGFVGLTDDQIAIQQIKAFKPDILWYTHYDAGLLHEIRTQVPSIRKVIGWVGSAIPKTDVWNHTDLILSCAPETATYFTNEGKNGVHLHHAFDTRILKHLGDEAKAFDLIFIGHIVKRAGFHNIREQLLEQLARQINFTVFSPNADQLSLSKRFISSVERVLSSSVKFAGNFLLFKRIIDANAELKRIYEKEASNWQLSPDLEKVIRSAVFGMDMYKAIHRSSTVLNIHADSSPLYASNMRLWETTGVGSCLLTDWKQNIDELFVPDKEVVVYRSPDECLEKITWLLNNPRQLQQIAEAGQQRCLHDHSYEKRVDQLVPIIRGLLN